MLTHLRWIVDRLPDALRLFGLGLAVLFLAVSVCFLGVLGCATVPQPRHPNMAMNSGVVVVSVEMNLPKRFLRFGAQDADRVFMYRIDGNAAPYTPGPLIWSDGIVDGHAVFLEVPPGRYAIAGAVVNLESTTSSPMTPVGSAGSVTFFAGMSYSAVTPVTAYFPDEVVRSLCVEVAGGGMAIAGQVEVDLGSIRKLDDAQRHAYRRVAPAHAAGKAGGWLAGKYYYSATARRVDQSQSRIDAISESVRSELSQAGWRWLEPAGPSTVAALNYVVPTSTPTPSAWTGAPFLTGVSLQVVDDVGSETSAEDVASFEQVLVFELADAGFAVGKERADLAIDVEVKELTSGSHFFSLRDESAVIRYRVTVSRPSGEILGRSDGERRLGDEFFTFQDPKTMGATLTTEFLIAQGAGDIVDYAQVLHRVPAEAIARWLSRPAIQIVLKDHVGTDYSVAGSADLEEMLAEELRTAGYRLGVGSDALTLEVEILKYEPGSRAKRLAVPGWGAARLAYEATVLDASGSVLGRTEGQKRYTGFELTDNPGLKSNRQLRIDMADHCAAQIGEYVQTVPVPAANHVSTAP